MKWKKTRYPKSAAAQEFRSKHPDGGELVITPEYDMFGHRVTGWSLYHVWADRINYTLVSTHRNIVNAKEDGERFILETERSTI